jgi:AraC-like DNA-binding protein
MIDARSPAMKLLQGYLFSLRAGGVGMDEGLLHVVARHIGDLVETAIGQAAPDGIELARRVDPEVILESARALMRQHHDDATMTIEDVSGWLTMPSQALAAAFEAAGTAFDRELSLMRLGFIGRDLRDPHLANATVAELALLHGLDDDADFKRLFEAVFGLDPAEYRRARSS